MKQNPHPQDLMREDLMDMEGLLCEQLALFFSFGGHALYFPTRHAPDEPQLLPRERKLLLPLQRDGALLGVVMLHGVRAREVRPLLPSLPAVAALCLENLARTKAARTDAVTGLATEAVLFSRMEDAAERVRAHLVEPAGPEGSGAPLHRLCMGLVLLRLANGEAIVREWGYAFAEDFLRALAGACRSVLPSDVLAARVGSYELALLLPATGRGACHKLARAALSRMEGVSLPCPLTRRAVRAALCAGHALYPQDMRGPEMGLEMFEQARLCMARARLAADVAGGGASHGPESRIMPFARILQEGGLVLERLPMGRARISLGRQAKAREGMRFAVWDRSEAGEGRYKGEIVLLHTRETDSVAEMLHLADAACQPEPGDALALLGEVPALSPDLDEQDWAVDAALTAAPPAGGEHGSATSGPDGSGPDAHGENTRPARGAGDAATTEALGHGDFLNRFSRECERCSRFALGILRLESAEGRPEGGEVLESALRRWRESMAPGRAGGLPPGTHAPLAGLYGSNSLIFFHPGAAAGDVRDAYANLCRALKDDGLDVAVGLAGHPFLQYRKAEAPDCALKALEYARLLPEPRVGQCNSLALNISADRRYSLGDVFGALEEYKLALLADKANVMAWNSLGVCMAALGRRHEARRHFLEALRHGPDDAAAEQIYYNLGTVCQGLEERRAAARYYRLCVKHAPEHLFAHIRLGQICEQSGRRAEARRFYERAAAIEDARPDAPSLARRHLARVAARQRKGGEARELLHEALLRNPQDAASMLLLANTYLDGSEDPAMAEILARKSAGLHDRPEAWQTLARALRALNREEEARLAEARAALA